MRMMANEVLAGRYRLEEPIATGGMGTVWRARDEVLQRPVALKLLNESLADDRGASERFRREALTAASITHPHMANVFDYIEDDGRPGIVMELVEGETLAQHIAGTGQLPLGDAARIASDVLTALQAAHDAGIIHRDVKPGNIMLTPAGQVKVGDFGIARSLGDASLTVTGTVMGTAHYSAPEQIRGEAATPCSDIYSTGVVLYEMLTGRRPFQGETAIAVATARLTEDPAPPGSIRSSIPPELDAVVMRALAREPGARFASAQEMRVALEDAMRGVQVTPVTSVLAVGPSDETIPMGAASSGVPHAEPPIVRELVPPRWAGRRVAMVLLPLLGLGLLAFMIVGAIGGEPADLVAPPPANATTAPPAPALVAVPDVIDLTQARATEILKARGLEVRAVPRYTESRRQGTVVDQSPVARQKVKEGSTITIWVARKPPERDDDKDDDDKRGGKGKGGRDFVRRGIEVPKPPRIER